MLLEDYISMHHEKYGFGSKRKWSYLVKDFSERIWEKNITVGIKDIWQEYEFTVRTWDQSYINRFLSMRTDFPQEEGFNCKQ